MSHRSVRLLFLVVAPIVSLAVLLPACWNTSGLGRLFGAPVGSGGNAGFDTGLGGGVVLHDLFLNARMLRDNPTVVKTAPAKSASKVSVKTPIVVQFSQTMLASTVKSGVSLFPKGGSTAVTTTTTMMQGDSVAVLIPQSDLLANTTYEIVVAGTVTDLQGHGVSTSGGSGSGGSGGTGGSGGGADVRFDFTTIASTGVPDFTMLFSSPDQQEGSVPRGAEIVLAFSEPFNSSTSGTGLLAPGNFVVERGGAPLTVNTDYTLTTVPTASSRVLQVKFTNRAGASVKVDAIVDKQVQNASGLKTLKGGQGFHLTFTAQDAAIPSGLAFPGAPTTAGKAGVIGLVHLHAFETDVSLTSDGQIPDSTFLVFFDATQQNALIFSGAASSPTKFVSDLQPQQNAPALLDGDVIVGSFVERKGIRSEVSILGTLFKDTVGPQLVAIGPPNLQPDTLFIRVNDPVLHGRMSEPCQGIQVDFNGTGVPDFTSILFKPGVATVTNSFFVTGVTAEAGALPGTLEPTASFSFIASDLFGNGSNNIDKISVLTAGRVGAPIKSPDGTTALYVSAFAGDDFLPFVTNGAVLLDAFPPDAGGMGQIARGVSTGSGVAKFTDAELASIPTAQVTVTVVGRRVEPTGGSTLFGPVTFGGLDKPSAASPRAILALLHPQPSITTTSRVQCDVLGESQNNPAESASFFARDVTPTNTTLDRFVPFFPNPGITDNIVEAPRDQLECFSVIERLPSGDLRWTSSEPFTAEVDPGEQGFLKQRSVDFTGQTSLYSGTSHPELTHSVTFDTNDVVQGGAVGLQGDDNTTDQFRELRIVSRVPGFVDVVGVAQLQVFDPLFNFRTGVAVMPLPYLQNNTVVGASGFEDTALEMLLQPTLVDPHATVDPVPLKRNLRVEMMVQDKFVKGSNQTQPASGYTRQRFVFDPTAFSNHLAAFQHVPTPTVTNSAHPPAIQWPEVTQGEGMHCMSLVDGFSGQPWKIYVPAKSGGGVIDMQVPHLPASLPDGVGSINFVFPGNYELFVESFDFDPQGIYAPGNAEQYQLDPQSWWQSDLEREFLNASRSDPNLSITTN